MAIGINRNKVVICKSVESIDLQKVFIKSKKYVLVSKKSKNGLVIVFKDSLYHMYNGKIKQAEFHIDKKQDELIIETKYMNNWQLFIILLPFFIGVWYLLGFLFGSISYDLGHFMFLLFPTIMFFIIKKYVNSKRDELIHYLKIEFLSNC